MLSILLSRGWVSEDDIGENVGYYLYMKFLYHTSSTYDYRFDMHVRIIDISGSGNIGGQWTDLLGGVRHFWGDYVTKNKIRGWISNDDNGSNIYYYLWSRTWYWMSSPYYFATETVGHMVRFHDNGWLYLTHLHSINGGVR